MLTLAIPTDWFLSLGKRGQALVDAALAAMGDESVRRTGAELDLLTRYLDQGILGDNTSHVERWIHAPTRSELMDRVAGGDVDRQDRDALRMAPHSEARSVFNQEASYWDHEPTGPVIAAVKGSNGSTGLLLYQIEDCGTGPYRWHGLFKSIAAVHVYLPGKGYLLDWQAVTAAMDSMVEDLHT